MSRIFADNAHSIGNTPLVQINRIAPRGVEEQTRGCRAEHGREFALHPRLHGGITSFRLAGRTGVQDNMAVAKRLLDEHRIFTVHRDGPVRGACVRVTPALFNSAADVGALVKAIRSIVPQS